MNGKYDKKKKQNATASATIHNTLYSATLAREKSTESNMVGLCQ